MDNSKVELGIGSSVGKLFPPHGTLTAWIEGNYFLAQSSGPYNLEMVTEYRKKMLPLFIEASSRGRFVVLSEYTVSMLASMDSIAYFAETIAIVAKEAPQLVGVAHVAAKDVEGRDMMAKIFEQKIYGPA